MSRNPWASGLDEEQRAQLLKKEIDESDRRIHDYSQAIRQFQTLEARNRGLTFHEVVIALCECAATGLAVVSLRDPEKSVALIRYLKECHERTLQSLRDPVRLGQILNDYYRSKEKSNG